MYGLQHSVRSAAVGGGDQIRERVLRVGAFISRKHGEDESRAVAGASRQVGRSGGCSLIAGGVGITNARALVQTQTLARAERGWLLLWLCRGPRKDRPMMSLGWQMRRAAARFRGLALVDGLLSWTAEERARQRAAPRVDISLNKTAVCAGTCTASTFSWSGASIPVRLRDFPFCSPHYLTCRRPLISPS